MTPSSQTNISLEEIAQMLQDAKSIVIAGHIAPDGDCLGSQLALMWALRSIGKPATVIKASKKQLPAHLNCLPGFDEIQYAGEIDSAADLFVAVDVPTQQRMEKVQWELHQKAHTTIVIDHHASDTPIAEYSYIVPSSASTTMLIWQLIKAMNIAPDERMATCAYAGLMTDTGSWQFQNTSVSSFELAAEMVRAGAVPSEIAAQVYQQRSVASLKLEAIAIDRMQFAADGALVVSYLSQEDIKGAGANSDETESIVNALRSLQGVRVACFMKEVSVNGQLFIKGSLRSKDNVNVALVAEKYEGGGHAAAAGFRMHCLLKEAVDTIISEFEAVLL